jgi:hypothetical protein
MIEQPVFEMPLANQQMSKVLAIRQKAENRVWCPMREAAHIKPE